MELRMTEASQEAKYSLELLGSEAGILKTISGRISGRGPGRKFIDDLYDALDDIEAADNARIKFNGGFSD